MIWWAGAESNRRHQDFQSYCWGCTIEYYQIESQLIQTLSGFAVDSFDTELTHSPQLDIRFMKGIIRNAQENSTRIEERL